MSLIKVQDLTFSYEGNYENVFENVSFQIDTDWKLGFIGRNGRGKTTFLNLLMKKYAYSGSITASVEFDYFPFPIDEPDELTYCMIEEKYPEIELWRVKKELNMLKMEEEVLYNPFSQLSNGEQTRVMLAMLFSKDNNFLLIDEPTNHLDMEARRVVREYLNGKKGFILVSHDRAFLDGCIDHVLSINKMDIEIQKGNFTTWNQNKEMKEQYERAENDKIKGQIRQLTAAAKRTEKWSDNVEKTKIGTHAPDRGYIGHKAAKMMKRSKAIENRVDKAILDKENLLKNIEDADALKIFPLEHHSESLITGKNIRIFYEEKQVCGPIDFSVGHGERLVLKGKNGSGKSSLLKMLRGVEIAYTGELYMANNLRISYVPQNTSTLAGNLENYIEKSGIEQSLFKTVLRKLDFSRAQFEKNMEEYSEGQKKKVLLARSLCTPAHIYIWDEPLNYIDILSRIQLQDLLVEYEPTMILVEHDANFFEKVGTRIIELG